MSGVHIERAYDPAAAGDGVRILVDRLWPRGLAKADAKIDIWLKDVAPSAALRHWFGHDPARWAGFRDRYRAELAGNAALDELLALARQRKRVTLLFAASDSRHSNAVALQTLCERALRQE